MDDLHVHSQVEVENLASPSLTERLGDSGYGEHDNILAMIKTFSHGNFPYLMIACLTQGLLLGGSLGKADKCVTAL